MRIRALSGVVLMLLLVVYCIPAQSSSAEAQDQLPEAEYKALCDAIPVDDPAMTRSSGKLPVHIVYPGRIRSFINDTVTVFGRFRGVVLFESMSIRDTELPLIDARFIDE